jgi:hypothetical protein
LLTHHLELHQGWLLVLQYLAQQHRPQQQKHVQLTQQQVQ